jgi:hypothetical protein
MYLWPLTLTMMMTVAIQLLLRKPGTEDRARQKEEKGHEEKQEADESNHAAPLHSHQPHSSFENTCIFFSLARDKSHLNCKSLHLQ